ncbi:MAG: hypothetical protein JSS83_22810, partial [Cyanobacteria bacterium SZAS LIN-3]|nr:hypothetical protein [Cyanobacteria bacterium SZAS LIN-3]
KPPAPPVAHKPDEKPCPPKKPPEQPVPPKKPPEVPCPPVKPPVKPPEVPCPPVKPPVKPPEVPVQPPPPVKPPEVPVQPPPPPRPSDTPRQVAVRYSPPAEPLRPFRNSDYQTPPAKTSVETPGTVTTQRTETSTETTTVTGRQSEAAIAIPATAGKVETEVRRQETLRATGTVVGLGGEKPGHQAGTPRSSGEGRGHGGDHAVPERTPGKREAQLRGTAEIEQRTAVEIKQTERPATAAVVAATGEAQVAVTTERASSEAASVQVTPPAADSSETPGQKTTSSNTWGEVSLSYSPGTKTTVATGTVGKFFDQQNYGYVQGTADLTKGKMGNVSAMYGHSILTPYDEKGQARRGNVNVEAGVVLNTGETLQGSKLPLFGKTAARVGVNGYYNLDQEGKTTVYGSADYASNPKQADAQVGISHKFAHDVTVSGGYQVSKVEGYKAGHYATTAISMKLSDRAEVYAGAAVSLDKQKGGNTNQVYTGVRFSF